MHSKPYVLVTGACGYIGSQMVLNLLDAGYAVIALDNLSTGFRESLLGRGEIFIEGDVGDGALLRSLFAKYPVTAVLHFAASVSVEESVQSPLVYYHNNTAQFIQLLRAVTDAKIPNFIFSSTAMVYASNAVGARFEETDPTRPENPYGQSKLIDETILRDTAAACGPGFRYVILRYFNVAGAEDKGILGQRARRATHLIKVACEFVVGKRKSLQIYGEDYPTQDGTCVRDYVHVQDLAEAHLAALNYLQAGSPSVTLNCGYGRGYSVKEVLDTFSQVLGYKLPVTLAERRPGDAISLIANPTQIFKTLDWKPSRDDLTVIIKTALDWERSLQSHLPTKS
ncbi:MAG: UDP-glucose 4-epimerase GalE [Oligoflexales bacterium]|nr:UDP-glucose 4-epimerase GalE [Oligoflexales bacterium]